jgi:transcriptional regulator with XRE-family HTH domain
MYRMAKIPPPQLTHNRLGALIRARREAQKIRRMELAAAAGVHVVTLANIELGRHDPSLWSLARMVDMLHLDPAEVFDAIDRRR